MSEEKTPRRKAEVSEAVAEVAPVVVPVLTKSISFEQWASARKIRPQHMRGMKAHVADVSRSRPASEWDAAFVNY